METPIADIWSLPNAREALTIFPCSAPPTQRV